MPSCNRFPSTFYPWSQNGIWEAKSLTAGRHYAVSINDRENLIIALERAEEMLFFELRVSIVASVLT